jgi:hypothetical protein
MHINNCKGGNHMYFNNESGAMSIMDAVVGGIVTIIGVLIVTNVNTAANLTGSVATMTGLIGLVLAAGGILYVVVRSIGA